MKYLVIVFLKPKVNKGVIRKAELVIYWYLPSSSGVKNVVYITNTFINPIIADKYEAIVDLKDCLMI